MRKNKTALILGIIIGALIIALVVGIILIVVDKGAKSSKKIIVDAPTNSEENDEKERVREFNEKFTSYEGEEISATLIKSLLSEIILSNNKNEERQLKLKIMDTNLEEGTDDVTEISDAQQYLSNEYTYSVECKTDDTTGYVTEIIIKRGESANIPQEVRAFNQNFLKYDGQIIKGSVVKGEMINFIKAASKENNEHKITLYSGELESLRDIKDEADYKVTLSYDEEGYIYRIDADEQSENNELRNAVNSANDAINSGNAEERNVANEIENMMDNVLQQYGR